MAHETRAYTACELGYDLEEGDIWVGGFPSGPMIRMNEPSFLILCEVMDADAPVTATQVADRLRAHVTDVPADIDAQVQAALDTFEQQALVRSQAVTPRRTDEAAA